MSVPPGWDSAPMTWPAGLGVTEDHMNVELRDRMNYLRARVDGPRVVSNASVASPTIDVATTDLYELTAQAANAAFQAPTGTPVNGQKLIVRIRDDGTARTLSWNAAFVAGGVALPTTTVANKWMHLGFLYNSTTSKWMLVARAEEA